MAALQSRGTTLRRCAENSWPTLRSSAQHGIQGQINAQNLGVPLFQGDHLLAAASPKPMISLRVGPYLRLSPWIKLSRSSSSW